MLDQQVGLEQLRQVDIYYDQDDISVRDSRSSDAEYLSTRLREADVREIWSSHHLKPLEALERSIRDSIICLTITINNCPVGIFGIHAPVLMSNRAKIFLLASDELDQISFRFVRHSRKFVELFLEHYEYLENHVHAGNAKSIVWLKLLRAELREAEVFGMEGEKFHYFQFKRLA